MSYLVKLNTSKYASKNDYIALREPVNIEELEEVIKKAMKINRIAKFSIGDHNSATAAWNQKFLEYLTLLALKYRPWQFRWISQQQGWVDVEWVDIDEWLNKYEEKS